MKHRKHDPERDEKASDAKVHDAKPHDEKAAPSAAPDATDAPAADPAAVELARLTAENELLKQRLLESAADLDNQAKRFGRERQVVRDEITARIAREMIEVLDNLDRVVASVPEAERQSPIVQGVVATQQAFLDRLRGIGIEPIEALRQPFDPFRHEAIAQEQRGDVPPGTVIDEITRGYRMGNQLVRAAKVRVASAPATKSTGSSGA